VFDFSLLHIRESKYKNTRYGQIVFCEGYRMVSNPLFNELLSIVPTKGEILEIETDLKPANDIYLGAIFLQHLHAKKWRVGATYQTGDITTTPTESMKNDLLAKLESTLNLSFNVVNHYCGIRPASPDRKPMMGTHPTYQNVHLVNGMGSKAISLAPVLVREMCDYMINNSPLHPEVDIQRFW
jgi:glycine/D-amino acid oxidase-like deaminating enzyme